MIVSRYGHHPAPRPPFAERQAFFLLSFTTDIPTDMQRYLILLLALSTLALTSCDNWINGVARDIELPPHEPELAPFVLIDAADTAIAVTLSKTTGVLDSVNPTLIRDAQIDLFHEGNFLYQLTAQDYDFNTNRYHLPLTGTFGNAPGEYTLRVTYPGYNTVTATQMMPAAPVVDSVALVEGGYIDPQEGTMDEIKFRITDDGAATNYYMVRVNVQSLDTTWWGDPGYSYNLDLRTNEPSAESLYYGSILLLTDVAFNGRSVNISLGAYLNNWGGSNEERILQVFSITRDYYTYLRSLNTYEQSSGNPFAEPSFLFDNTTSGFGFFGLSQHTATVIE